MEENKKNSKEKTKEEKNWKNFALNFAENFVKNFSLEIVGNIKEKIHETGLKLKGNLMSMFFIMLSLAFLMIGISQIIEFYLRISGIGYLIVGFFLLLLGLVMKLHYSNKN